MTPLARRLRQCVDLTPAENAVVEDLQAVTMQVRRNREIVAEGRKYDELFVLIEGFAIRYRILRDGKRQVLSIVLPGDFIGFPGTFFERALYSIASLTDAVVARFPFVRLRGLFDTRIMRLWWTEFFTAYV